MAKELSFSKEQDLILLKQAVAVSPFCQGKGKGWKMIANKLMNLTHFPSTLKSKTVRERILFLMERKPPQKLTLSLKDTSTDEYDDETLEMETLIQSLLELREEAMKMAIQNGLVSSDDAKQAEESTSALLAEETHHPGQNEGTNPVSEEGMLSPSAQGVKEKTQDHLAPLKMQSKRKLSDLVKESAAVAGTPSSSVMAFLQDREAKRLKLREEELALRREELAQQKKLVALLESRLDEEKTIREEMFQFMSQIMK